MEDLAKAYNNVFVYDGCFSPFRKHRHGSQVGSLERTRFVVCVQNHDQVGSRAKGDRFRQHPSPPATIDMRFVVALAVRALVVHGRGIRRAEAVPFFCSFSDAELIEAVPDVGRIRRPAIRVGEGNPRSSRPRNFPLGQARLGMAEIGSLQAKHRQLYQDLLAVRRQWPALRDRERTTARLIHPDLNDQNGRSSILLLKHSGENGLLAVANLSARMAIFPAPGTRWESCIAFNRRRSLRGKPIGKSFI